MARPVDQRWAANLVASFDHLDPGELVRLVADWVMGDGARPMASTPPSDCGGWDNPWLIGLVHEQAVSFDDRRQRGAWYTPQTVVRGLVRQAFDALGSAVPSVVVDPTCGGGAFLLASLDELVHRGVSIADALPRVHGADIDAGAVAASQLAIRAWAHLHGVDDFDPCQTVVLHDSLLDDDLLDDDLPGAIDLIIGNPPFASPLKKGSIGDGALAYRAANDGVLGPYADLATWHLHRSLTRITPGGVVSLVLPQSTLSSRDVAPLRSFCESHAALRAAWATSDFVFDAGVRVWAPAFVRGAEQGLVSVASGASPVSIGDRPYESWRDIVADALGAPALERRYSPKTLGSLVSATAGFRDEYYGLAAACQEAGNGEPPTRLATVGSIDPLMSWWGRRPTRFASQHWDRPTIERSLLDAKVARWLDDQLVPKVLVATQTRVLEPFIDREGIVAPSTPLIAVHGDVADLSRIAAVLLAPPVTVWLYRRCFGAALSGDAIKVSASQLSEVPLPRDGQRWEQAAALIDAMEIDAMDAGAPVATRSVVAAVAQLMNEAYGSSAEVLAWWFTRLGPPPT
ncbi:MAG: N-6 DNA methylase [Acidimicrobiales bacterium]